MKLKNVFKDIAADVEIDRKVNRRSFSRSSIFRVLAVPQLCSMSLYRFSHFFYVNKFVLLSKIIRNINIILFGNDIQPGAKIMGGCFFGHTVGIVIGPNVFIDKGCLIFNGVTITPAKNPDEIITKNDILKIGKNVRIFAGAKIIGILDIADNVTIGANSVVLKSIGAGLTVAGVPAKPIKNKNSLF